MLLSAGSLEEDNFTTQELVDAACDLAANPPEGRAKVALALTGEQFQACHTDRCGRVSGKLPGIADTLISMARSPEHGSANMSKPELAAVLARRVMPDVQAADGSAAFATICEGRPIVRFVLERPRSSRRAR